MKELELLHRDNSLVIVNKPAGMLVHRTNLDPNENTFLLQILRNQLGCHVFPVHRLDKPTSGVLLFALNENTARSLTRLVLDHKIEKEYRALVRGWFPDELIIDRGIRSDRDKPRKEAVTLFKCLHQVMVNQPVGAYETARYSLISAHPRTGRRHQIRKHLNHCSHPILGDTWYGDRDHNRFFFELTGMQHLFLHARSICFRHPESGRHLTVCAPYPDPWYRLASLIDLDSRYLT